MLQVHNLTAGYGPLTALSDVSLSLAEARGSASSATTAPARRRCCNASSAPCAARRQGRNRRRGSGVATIAENVRRGIAFVPQGHNVFPNLSVEQNLDRRAAVRPGLRHAVYELFPVLAERRQQRAGSLSGGEQQMLALGMALMTRPKWLLLDEPSTGLAPVIVRNVMRRLGEINERWARLDLVEQNVPATLKMVEQAIILRSGRVVFHGSAQELSGNTDLWKWF